MDSLAEYDPTLPLDFENSANPDLLTEVSLSHLEHADGSVPLVAKINSGRKSPLRARTMKEYETQITELKKENFSLKLRIYYLDERMQQKFGEDDVFKTNIELKVDLDSVKKDLSEKQELLKKASAAMETMSQTHQEELAQIRQQHQAAIRRLQGPLERQLQTSQQEIFLARKELEEARSRVQALEGEIRGYERQRQDVDSSKQNDEKAAAENKRLIEELRVSTKSKNSRIDELEAEVKSLDSIQLELQENVRRLEAQLEQKQLDLEAEIADRDDKTRGLQRELTQARANLEAHKQRMNGMEDDLRKKDKTIKELENEARKKTEEVQLQLEIGTRLKKTVQGITVALHDKIKELAEMSGKLEDKEAELKSAREELHRLNMDRLEGVEKQHAECRDHYDTIERLKRELSAYKDDQQELKRSLTQRDGETSSFKELLSEAEKSLRQREDIVQVLQGQVEKERALCTDKLESQTQHYQALLDDGQRQLENKERMLTQLTESLRDKDRQLQECVSVLKPSRSEDNTGAYLKSFQERLTEKEKAIEEALEEKYRCLEERDREVRELKNTLRERDRDLERANQMLLNAEERVDSLETELKENNKTSKQLANSLRASQKQGEESQETFTQSLEEKEAAIKRLQNSLAAKDKALQEALEMSAGVDDVQLHQQRQRLAEKEKLITELTEELNQAQQKYDSLIKDKNQCLKDKDNHTKQLSDALNQEISDLGKEVHRLQAELNKKEYELQTSKSSAVWAEEQHKEALESVRNAVREKDKTIQMLSDSLKEREELFREMQGSNCSDRSHLLGRLAEVQGLKEEVALLQNELQDKQDQIERLRRVKSRQSLCESPVSDVHTSTHEIHRHIEKVVEEQMNETRRLNDALQNERQIYINLNTADPQRSSSIEVELAAIRSLRGELEEGLERNKQLRATLEAQASEAKAASLAQSPGDKADCDRLKEQVEELRNELEETKRLNSSLHTCLQENQRRNSDTTSQREVPIADISVSTYSFAEPSSLHLDEVSLRQLSSPDLRQTVKDLHGQLSDSHRLNLSLKGQLAATETFRDVPGENSNDGNKSDSSLARLKQQLSECEKELLTKEVENRGLRFKFGLIPEDEIVLEDLPNVDELQADILVMKATLDSVENINTHLKQIHINSQNEKTASQAYPDLIMQMAAETEKLKSELDSAKKELEQRVVVSSDTKVLVSSQDKGPSNHYPSSRARSQIPRLRRDISSLPQLPSKSSNRTQLSCSSKIPVYKKPTKPQIPDLDSLDLSNPETMYSLLKQYRSQLLEVQNKLASTEATVRTQGRRCRYYKSLLYQGGLLPTAPFRNQSESCLFNNSVRAEDVLSSASNLASQDQEPLKTSSSENLHSDLEKSIVSSDYSETLKSLTRLVEEKDAVIQNLLEKTAKFPPNISSSCHTATQTHPLVISSHDSDNHSRDQSVNKTDHAMSSRCMASVNGDNTKHAGNENLVEKDREICILRKQLIDSDNIKHALSKDVFEKDHEICSLRKQLVESQNMCHQLCSQLQELGELVIEYVQREDDGSNATQPGRKYDNIVQSLNNTQVLVRDLSSMLEVSETDTDGGVTSHGPTFDMQNKYDKALKEIQQLQQQLKQDSESHHQKSSNQEQITQKLREEIRGQDCILESQTEEITRLQNYTEQKSREVTRLQSEVKSLQELVRNLQSRSSGTSVRSAAVGESRDPDENTVAFQLYNNNRDTESESMLSDDSWDALEREGYRPAGKTSNAKSRTRVRGYQLTDSMESDNAGMEAPQRRRSKPVRNIARKNGTHHINSQEDSVIERQRHQSANGNMNAHLQNGQRGSTEGFAVGEESSSSSLAQTSRGRHRTDPTMQKSQSSGVSGNRADGLWASQNSRDIFIQNGRVSQDSQTSQSVDGVDFPPSLTDHTYPGVPDAVPDIDRYSLSGVDSDAQSSKASKSRSIVHAQSDGHVNGNHASSSQSSQVEILSSKLKTAEVVNQTLKDELRIYHNIRQSIGVGPGPLEQFDSRMSFGTGTQTSVLVDDSDTQLLRENLAEIRAMRIRLEASLTQNDNLRVQLQGKLSTEDTQSTGTSKTLHIHELGKDKLENVQQKVIYIESQLTEKERILKEKTTIITKHERLIREKTRCIEEQTSLLQQRERQLGEKTDLCQKLTQEIEMLSADLKSSGKNVQRLSEEKEVLAQQLQEHQDLNNTLKLELSLLERLQPDTPADGENSSRKGFDLRELMIEIRRLRDQLERCIDTNNSLRQKLEERLGQESPRPQQGGVNVIRHVHSTDSSRPDSKDAADGMPSPDAQRRHLAAHRTQRTETYVEEQETRSQGLQNCSPRSQGSYDGGRLNLPYGSSVDLNRSGHSSDGSAGHMMSGVDTLRSQHSQSSEERDVLNGFLHSPRGLSRTWPHVSHNSTHGVSFLSATSLPVGPHSPSSHNRSLPVRHASEGNLTYHVYDPPASLFDGFPAGVDPDIRHLFAVGKVDDYEHLSKENNECRTVLSGVQARITERLSRFKGVSQSQSVEYSTLKELSLSVDNLRMCLCEESRLIASFWVTQLPDCNEKGEFFSPRLIEKNDQLQSELYMLKLKYNLLASAAKDAQTRLHATNRQKEGIEEAVIQQLSRTEKVLRHARGNLEVKAKSAQRH